MDFLELKSNVSVQQILSPPETTKDCQVLTDYVLRINSKLEKSRKILLLSCKAIANVLIS